MTGNELQYCGQILKKDAELRAFLESQRLIEPPNAKLWFAYLASVKDIQGNISNSLGFVATLLAKEYLAARFNLIHFDAAEKAQGAPGPDIEARTVDGQSIRCEIKTTRPYQPGFGAQQKVKIKEDLKKLINSPANYKIMFVTDADAFKTLCKRYYSEYARGIEVVNLITSETYCHV